MSQSGFKHDHEVVRWAATQLPNLPHIQSHLRDVADGLEKQSQESADGLSHAGLSSAGGALGNGQVFPVSAALGKAKE